MKKLGIILSIVLVSMVSLSPPQLLYDEPYHIEGAMRLLEGWSLADLLARPTQSALGPLYPIIHTLAAPFTGLQVPSIRIVNLLFLSLSIAFFWLHLSRLGDKFPADKAFGYLAIPMVWVCTGMALTELPAQLFALLAVMATSPFLDGNPLRQGPTKSILDSCLPACYGFAAGIALGLAILGRQGYIVATPLFLAPVVFSLRNEKSFIFSGFALVGLLFCTVPVFRIWGGLTPASLSSVGGFSFSHGVLGFLCLGIMTVLVCPQWFAPLFLSKVARIVVLILASGLAAGFSSQAPMPMKTVMSSLPAFIQAGSRFCLVFAGSGLVLAFFFSCYSLVRSGLLASLDVTCLLTVILGAATCFALKSQFSSRYLLSSLPFLLYAVRSQVRPKETLSLACAGIGALLGIASLGWRPFAWCKS